MIKGIHHIAVGVPDFEKGLEFYTQVLGFDVEWNSAIEGNDAASDSIIGLSGVSAKVAMLKAPNINVELWEYESPTPETRSIRPCDFGYTHIALQVSDIKSEYKRLLESGMTFVGEPVDMGSGSFAIYGRDPFGNTIELYELGDT